MLILNAEMSYDEKEEEKKPIFSWSFRPLQLHFSFVICIGPKI